MTTIAINKGKVHIKELIIEDDHIATYLITFKDNEEQLEEAFLRALTLGVFALTDDRTGKAIRKLEDELHGEFKELITRLRIAKAIEDIEPSDIVRGWEFESGVPEILKNLSNALEDEVEIVGAQEGSLPKVKKGDIVVKINPKSTLGIEKKIVLETKSRKILSRPEAHSELIDAKANRQADKAILVFDADACPSWIKDNAFVPLEPDGIAVTVTDDEKLPLELAYRIARYEVISEISPKKQKLDLGKAKRLIAQAKNLVKSITSIKGSLSKGIKNLEKTREELDPLTDEFNKVFDELDAIFTESK